MAVNGIEIKVGQVWRQGNGLLVHIVKSNQGGWETGDRPDKPNMAFIDADGRCSTESPDFDLVELIQDEHGMTIWRGGEQPAETKGKHVEVHFRDRSWDAQRRAADVLWTDPHLVKFRVVNDPPASTGDYAPEVSDPNALAAEMLSDLGYRWDGQCWAQELPPAAPPAPADRREYTGGSVSYYSVEVTQPTTEGRAPYIAECNDLIEALQMNYAEANVLKALWRICAARRGLSKRGYTDGVYDAEKINFFGARVLVQQRKEGGAA